MDDEDTFNANIEKFIEKLRKCEYIMEKEVKILCDKAKEIFSKENNVIYLNTPITVGFLISNKKRSAGIFTDNFTIYLSYSELEAKYQKLTTCFWEILLTEVTIQLRRFYFY